MVARVRQTSGRPTPDFGQKWTCANETEPSMTEYDIAKSEPWPKQPNKTE